jgi:ribosomal protein S21
MQRRAVGTLSLALWKQQLAAAGAGPSAAAQREGGVAHAAAAVTAAAAPRSLSHLSASSSSGASLPHPPAWRTQPGHPQPQQQQQQQRRGIFVVVNVRNNNVDVAYRQLNRHCADNGLYQELRRRDHRETNHELAFQSKRSAFNKRMGQQIRDRLRWIIKRRHLKM